MLAPLSPRCEVVQFKSLPSEPDLRRLAEFLTDYPNMRLRAYGGYDGSISDLEFLRFFPRVRRFHVTSLRYQDFISIDGLRFLPDDLEELAIGQTQRRLSLEPLARFQSLRTLYLEAQTKQIEVISGLPSLEDVTLRSITLPDLSLLAPLRRLRSLDIKLGGTQDLAVLPQLESLAYLELWGIRGLEDISPIATLGALQYLFLQDLARVDRLPNMTRMSSLRRVHIENLKNLTDLSPLLTAPALEELVMVNARHLTPEHFARLTSHPTLTSAQIGLGSKRKNDLVARLISLPRPSGAFSFR
jgi:hypothetical protein